MSGKSNKRTCFVWLFAALLLIGALRATTVSAQVESTATISGTVTDSSRAAVAGAMVTVKNSNTGVTNATVTDSQGRYTVPELIIGTYEVDVQAAGFQKIVHGGIILTVGSQTVVDAMLQVGTVQQTVTVESDVTHVETTSSAVSTLVENTQLVDLPLNGRSYESLIALAPGVFTVTTTGTTGGSLFYGQQNNYAISGARPSGQQYLLDDTNTADFWNHAAGSGALGTNLGIDSIAQFETLTSTYSAQFGGAGAAINASTKSGTNNFHGTAYEFLRNTAVEAENFYVPTATPLPVPTLNRNQFGAALGGPIKKDKAFFFVNYEGLRMVQNNPVELSEPDLAAHGCQGLTAQTCESQYGGVGPNTPTVNGKSIPYPACNGGNAALWPNSAYPLGNGCDAQESIMGIMSLLPIATAADNPATGLAQISANNLSYSTENYILGRVDYTLSDKDSIFARVVSDTAKLTQDGALGGQDGVGTAPYMPLTATTADTYATVEERHIFSPTLLNTVHLSYVRPAEAGNQYGQPTVNPALWGAGNGQAFANCTGCLANSPAWYFPTAGVANAPSSSGSTFSPFVEGRESGASFTAWNAADTAGQATLSATSTVPFYLIPNNFTLGDDVVWTRGAHSFKFGASVERMDEQTWAPFETGGSWTASTSAVGILGSGLQGSALGVNGSSLAGFLAGQFTAAGPGELPDFTLANANLPPQDGTLDVRETLFAMYAEDTWKLTRGLTATLGLRYEPTLDPTIANHLNETLIDPPFSGATGSEVTIANSGIGPNGQPTYPTGTNCLTPLANGGLPLACGWVPVPNDKVFQHNISLKNWDPRIGIAWDPFKDHKTSIRIGSGMFHTVIVARDYDMWIQPPASPGSEGFAIPTSGGVTASSQVPGSPNTYPFIFTSTNPCAPTKFATTGPGAFTNANASVYTNCLSVSQGGATDSDWGETPYTIQYNINVQREVAAETVVTIGFVGSRGVDLVGQRDFNAILPCGGTDPITGSPIYTQGFNGGFASATGGSGASTGFVSCPRSNPTMLGLSLLNTGFNSWYHSLQASLNHRFSRGFQTQVSYAYSQSIDTISGSYGLDGGGAVCDPWDFNVCKGLSGFSRYNNLHINSVYSLPFKKNMLVSGWQLGGIFTYLSGTPASVTGLAVGGYGATANVVAGCNPYTGATAQEAVNRYVVGSSSTLGLTTNPYFNASCFTAVPEGEVGNAGRDVLIGPGGWNLDMNIIKDTRIPRISENFVLEFRFEAFNVLNHPDFANAAPTATLWTLCNPSGAAGVYGAAAPANSNCGTIGQIQTIPTTVPLGVNSSSASFGQIGDPLAARQIQFGLRASF